MTSLIKSSYKLAKSYLSEPTQNAKISWTSILILYKDDKNKLRLEKGYIFIGDISDNIHGYYTNFVNWNTINNKLIYNNIAVDPYQVHLHVHVGDTIFETDYFKDNPTFYSHYFSSPGNKIYKAIKEEIQPNKIKIINFTDNRLYSKLSLKERLDRFHDPRFFTSKRQIYGESMDHLMYTGLNIAML